MKEIQNQIDEHHQGICPKFPFQADVNIQVLYKYHRPIVSQKYDLYGRVLEVFFVIFRELFFIKFLKIALSVLLKQPGSIKKAFFCSEYIR